MHIWVKEKGKQENRKSAECGYTHLSISPALRKTEAKESRVQSQPELTERPCLRKKKTQGIKGILLKHTI
jgi:hypothetical protein